MQIFSVTNKKISMYLFKHPCLSQCPSWIQFSRFAEFQNMYLDPGENLSGSKSNLCTPVNYGWNLHPGGKIDQFDNPGQNCFRLGQSYSKMDYFKVKKLPAAHFTLILIEKLLQNIRMKVYGMLVHNRYLEWKKLRPEEMLREEKMLPKPTTRHFVDLVCISLSCRP